MFPLGVRRIRCGIAYNTNVGGCELYKLNLIDLNLFDQCLSVRRLPDRNLPGKVEHVNATETSEVYNPIKSRI
jgi:hypothetical protein